MRRLLLFALLVLLLPASAHAAEPPVRYGVAKQLDLPVTMQDGTVLRADVYTPVDPETGRVADGPFPVILNQTPYGRSVADSVFGGTRLGFVARGYIFVIASIRGTGDSQGTFDLADPQQGKDGAEVVQWASKLPRANGDVGTYGSSYGGIIQFLTAAELPTRSPLKAMVPIVPSSDLYRDTVYDGGLFNLEFMGVYSGLVAGLNTVNPLFDGAQGHDDTLKILASHTAGVATWQAQMIGDAAAGSGQVFDGPFWQARAPMKAVQQIADRRVPVQMVGGWFDLFQRGVPLLYAGLQNAAAGRPVGGPMDPDRVPDPRFQATIGPWYHLSDTTAQGVNGDTLALRWFDRWLKGERNGVDDTREPLRLYDLATKKFVTTGRYPVDSAPARTYFFGDGTLSTTAPATGTDDLVFSPASLLCSESSWQWSAGVTAAPTVGTPLEQNPCNAENRQNEIAPFARTYTTPALDRPRVLAGPIGVRVVASSTNAETQWMVTVSDVAPDGTSRPLTMGALLGSRRAVDPARSWPGQTGSLLPWHPYTRASVERVVPGAVATYDIEVRPTFVTIARGHRIRVTLSSSDTPHLLPSLPALGQLAGGVATIRRGASLVELPLADPVAFGANTAPVARLRVTRRGGRVTLDSRRSADPGGRVIAWRWTVARKVVGRKAILRRTLKRGTRVTLTVTDDRGATTVLRRRL